MGFLIQSEEERALEDLATCLGLSKWNKIQARHILIGCVPEEISPIMGRPALLPGDSPLRGVHNDASFKGHFDMEWVSVDFVDQAKLDLSPMGWVRLAGENNYSVPWLEIVAHDPDLFRLLKNSGGTTKALLAKAEVSNVRRSSAACMHEVNDYYAIRRLYLYAWDVCAPEDGKECIDFNKWAIKTFVEDLSVQRVGYGAIRNWRTELRAERERKRAPESWVEASRYNETPEIPEDFKLPSLSRVCRNDDMN